MKVQILYLLAPILMTGCASYKAEGDDQEIVSLQIIDRHEFSESITSKDRLGSFQQVDFLSPQPYKKVMRTFQTNAPSDQKSIITTYHDNGLPFQYLEIQNRRANGAYREWHPNGKLRMEVNVIEGMPDLNEVAMASWVFDGTAHIFDEDEHPMATISYEKGILTGSSTYFNSNGSIKKIIPYEKGVIAGELLHYGKNGEVIKLEKYELGNLHGQSFELWEDGTTRFKEIYSKGKLDSGEYFDKSGNLVSQVIMGEGQQTEFTDGNICKVTEYKNGVADGKVRLFDENGIIIRIYHVKNHLMQGEELEFYPSDNGHEIPMKKMRINWRKDEIQEVKTWFKNGKQQSQTAYTDGKKQGECISWYEDGSLMFIEKYKQGKLISGKYYKIGSKTPVSTVVEGSGAVKLFDEEGYPLKTITYENGQPIIGS